MLITTPETTPAHSGDKYTDGNMNPKIIKSKVREATNEKPGKIEVKIANKTTFNTDKSSKCEGPRDGKDIISSKDLLKILRSAIANKTKT